MKTRFVNWIFNCGAASSPGRRLPRCADASSASPRRTGSHDANLETRRDPEPRGGRALTRQHFGVRWQSAATTPLWHRTAALASESAVAAIALPAHSKTSRHPGRFEAKAKLADGASALLPRRSFIAWSSSPTEHGRLVREFPVFG